MKHITSQFSLVVSLLCFSLCGKAQSSHEREESIPYGDFDKWMVRVIDESLIIGGRSKCLYEVAPADTVRGDIPYKSSSESPWRTSNVMARVSGVTKCSVSVFPEPRDSGYCVRLETLLRTEEVSLKDSPSSSIIPRFSEVSTRSGITILLFWTPFGTVLR